MWGRTTFAGLPLSGGAGAVFSGFKQTNGRRCGALRGRKDDLLSEAFSGHPEKSKRILQSQFTHQAGKQNGGQSFGWTTVVCSGGESHPQK